MELGLGPTFHANRRIDVFAQLGDHAGQGRNSPSLRKVSTFEVILKGKVRPPAGSGVFEATLRKYANQAGDHGELKTTPKSTESASRVNR